MTVVQLNIACDVYFVHCYSTVPSPQSPRRRGLEYATSP